MESRGYIKLYRKFFDTPLWTEPREYSRSEAWLDLIQAAAIEQRVIILDGRAIELRRGELLVSKRYLEKRWGWSIGKVTRFMQLLQEQEMVTVRAQGKYTVITLCNYDKYNPLSTDTENRQDDKRNSKRNSKRNTQCVDDYRVASADGTETEHKTEQWRNSDGTVAEHKTEQSRNSKQDAQCVDDYRVASADGTETEHKTEQWRNTGQEEKESNKEKEEEEEIKEKTLSNERVKKKDAAVAATNDRKKDFHDSLVPYVATYGREMIRDFYAYWSELNRSGTKMRYELQPTWELGLRLSTWARREKEKNCAKREKDDEHLRTDIEAIGRPEKRRSTL